MTETRTIAVGTHGRYLVLAPRLDSAPSLLVGFHGYAEAAAHQMERLQTIPGAECDPPQTLA